MAAPDIQSVQPIVLPRDLVRVVFPVAQAAPLPALSALPDMIWRWNHGQPAGTPVALTYGFTAAAPSYTPNYLADPAAPVYEQFTDAEKANVAAVFAAYQAVAGISFTLADAAGAQLVFRKVALAGPTGYAYFPPYWQAPAGTAAENASDGDAYFEPQVAEQPYIVFHELGHALGIGHAFDPGHPRPLDYGLEGGRWLSVVDQGPVLKPVYVVASETSIGVQTIFHPSTPMPLDILMLQMLYGRNTETNAGDTVYRYEVDPNFYQAIWDAGGTDTIDLSNQVHPNVVSLRDGSYTSIGLRDPWGGLLPWQAEYLQELARDRPFYAADNYNDGSNVLAIAFDAIIENAIGGGAGDRLIGNAVANTLRGGGGNDTLQGQEGNDWLLGEDGDDLLEGGPGEDRLDGGSGNDTLRASGGAATLDGGDGDDTLLASGLAQGSLTGGAGVDTFELAAQQYRMHVEAGAGTVGPLLLTDFSAGAGGDRLESTDLLHNGAPGYDGSDPFASGRLLLLPAGTDTLLAFDPDGAAGGGGSVVLARLQGVAANTLVAANFSPGFEPRVTVTNHAPVLATPATLSYTDTAADDSFGRASGTLSATDAEGDVVSFGITGGTLAAGVASQAGVHGVLAVTAATGAYVFVPDDDAIEALKAPASESFTVTVADAGGSSSATLMIELTGADDPTVFGGDTRRSVTEDGTTTAGGRLFAADRDTSDAAITPQQATAGAYGSFSIGVDGRWSYSLHNGAAAVQALATGQEVADTFAVATAGGSSQDIVVTVRGSDEGAALGPEPADLSGMVYHWKSHVLLGEVAVTAAGLGTMQTDAMGGYLFSQVPAAQYTVDAARGIHDTSNAITSADALAALRIAVGVNPNSDPDGAGPLQAPPLSPYQLISADVNGSGSVTSADALAILRMAVKQPSAVPAAWLFVEETRDFWDEAAGTFRPTRQNTGWDPALPAVAVPPNSSMNLVGLLRGDVNGSWAAPAGSADLDALAPGYFQELLQLTGTPAGQWHVDL